LDESQKSEQTLQKKLKMVEDEIKDYHAKSSQLTDYQEKIKAL
jgi:uncharacterized protein YlxW (UPF0749 family)